MSFQALRAAAESGDGKAQLQLGIALMTGQAPGGQDLEAGRDWLGRAAGSGQPEAARFLGLIHLRGMDVITDIDQALDYLRAAAEAGDAEAQFHLGAFLGGSRDAHYDGEAALAWLRQAAEAGQARAMAHLAHALAAGGLTPPDPETALRWWIRAAGKGDPGALLALAEHLHRGCLLPRDSRRALGLARRAAQAGWPVAGEYAKELARDGTQAGPDWRACVPDPAEVQAKHAGRLPRPVLEVRSWEPRVVLNRHLLSTFECAEIAAAAEAHLQPSFIVDADGRQGRHQVRTSHEVRLRPGIRNTVVNIVERRLAEWSHFPVSHGELPLVLHYQDSQSFEQHYDYFIPEKFAMGEGPLEFGGQRVATQLVYLNQDFEGGETRFERTGLVVRPERGMCMLFHNLTPAHNVDPLTRHTGVAVTGGVKWLLSRWIREMPFEMRAAELPRDRYREPGLSEPADD